MDSKLLITLLIFLVAYSGVRLIQARGKRGQKYRIISVEKIENCDVEDNLPINHSMSVKKPGINKLEVYGDIVITEVIPGPIYLSIIVYRCDIGLTNCNNYNEFKVPEICSGLLMKNMFTSPMVEKIKPPVSCPLQADNYTLYNGTWDLSIMSGLPLEGYRWLFWARLFDQSREKPRKVFCMKTQAYVSFGHRNSRT